jgi:hypothetical protein
MKRCFPDEDALTGKVYCQWRYKITTLRDDPLFCEVHVDLSQDGEPNLCQRHRDILNSGKEDTWE